MIFCFPDLLPNYYNDICICTCAQCNSCRIYVHVAFRLSTGSCEFINGALPVHVHVFQMNSKTAALLVLSIYLFYYGDLDQITREKMGKGNEMHLLFSNYKDYKIKMYLI